MNSYGHPSSVSDTINFILNAEKSINQKCDDLNGLARYFSESNKLKEAESAANKSFELSEENNYEKGIYDSYSIKGTIAMLSKDDAKVISIYNKWLDLAEKNNSDYGKNGAAYLHVKLLYKQAKMDSVILVSKKTLAANRGTYDSLNLPKFNTMLGNVYYKQGDFRNAGEYYLKALTIAEITNNEKLQASCIGNLAIINKELKNYREALNYNAKALELRIKNNQLFEVAGAYNNMATCYENMNLLDSAIYFHKKALTLFESLNSKENIALVSNNLGQLLNKMNQPDSGMYYLQSARKEFIELADTINIANNAWALGNGWRLTSINKSDKSYLNDALDEMLICKNLAEIKELEDLKMNCYKSLSLIYEEIGNKSQAFLYLKKYIQMNDSIRSNTYTSQIAEMQTKYETNKKQTEIEKLNSEKLLDAEKIARQKTMNYSLILITSLILISVILIFRNVQKKRFAEKRVAILEKQYAIENMRSKIASDVHDDMGANLTRIGLYSEQLMQMKEISEKEKRLLERISLQSKEVITGMKEIIWASNPANDNLKSMLGFMRQYIDRFFDGTEIRATVNFPLNAGEVMLHPEVRRNLFLILKESLNNAAKYSGSDRIHIVFTNENESFNFNIKDYGKGFNDEIKKDFSNGLHNMQMRAEQINSTFKLISSPGKGVQIFIEGTLY